MTKRDVPSPEPRKLSTANAQRPRGGVPVRSVSNQHQTAMSVVNLGE